MDAKAYDKCFKELSEAVHCYVRKRLRNKEYTEDIVQASFIALWKWHEKIPEENAMAYLIGIVNNKVAKAFKEPRLMDVYKSTAMHRETNEVPEGIRVVLDKAFWTLDPLDRSVVLLKFHAGYSYFEIAEMKQMTEKEVDNRLYRSVKKMRAYIGKIENVLNKK